MSEKDLQPRPNHHTIAVTIADILFLLRAVKLFHVQKKVGMIFPVAPSWKDLYFE